jgi:hypothetical protein
MKSRISGLILLLATAICVAQGQIEDSPSTSIVFTGSYNSFGGGDFIFQVANPTSSCTNGYWLTKSDPGFNANVATIIGAYHAKSPVRVSGQPDKIWPGSGGRFCKLWGIIVGQ